MILELLLCLVWTLTEPCEDDRLRWKGPRLTVTYEELTLEEVAPGLLIGCFEGTIRIWNPAMPEKEGANPLFFWWDAEPGRLMEWDHDCDLICRRCITWEEGDCVESELIPGTTCCLGAMCAN